jgi:hypothetical protein
MQFSPLAIKRYYILGNLAEKCEPVGKIPVYLDDISAEPIGYADESLGRYADAFVFHLPEEICKRLATNGYDLDVDYQVCDQQTAGEKNARIKLNHIILTSRAPKSVLPRRQPYANKESL